VGQAGKKDSIFKIFLSFVAISISIANAIARYGALDAA